MSSHFAVLDRQVSLRQRAETRVSAGSATVGGLANASAALGVLLELASSPSTASDALALLHELQVHQVELDLQDEELRNTRDELEVTLRRQVALYDHAPVGYLTIDAGTVMHELNLTSARLLGRSREELLGASLNRFLQPRSADDLQALLARVREGRLDQPCSLLLQAHERGRRVVHATASADPAAGRFLVALVDMGTGGSSV